MVSPFSFDMGSCVSVSLYIYTYMEREDPYHNQIQSTTFRLFERSNQFQYLGFATSMASTPHHNAENPPKNFVENKATFKPKQLNIVWGQDARYWKVPREENEAAELLQVCWLEVSGNISNKAKGNKYRIKFSVSLKSDAFGWNNCPVYVMAKYGRKGQYFWKKYHLQDKGPDERLNLTLEISPPNLTEEDNIFFGLYEVWSGKWKGGLLLHEAVVENLGK